MTKQKSTHVDSSELVGRRIRELRTAAGLRQGDLSFPGCTPAYISRVEAGARIPSLQVLEEIGRRLGVSAEFLARGGIPKADEMALADAQLAQRLGELEEARASFDELAGSSDSAVRKAALLALGQLALGDGDAERAIAYLESYERLPPRLPVDAAAVEALTDAYWLRGDRASAIALLEDRLEAAGDDHVAAFRISVFLANALIDTGRFEDAERLLVGTVASLGPTPDSFALARVLWAQSRMQVALGASDRAARYAEDALAIIRVTEHAEYAARACQLLAFIELERGNAVRALELLDDVEATITHSGDQPALAKYRLERARALASVGRTGEAQELAEVLVRDVEMLGPVDAARALAVLAQVFSSTGNPNRAIDLYEAAANALSDVQEAPMLVSLYTAWSDLLAENGRTEEALQVARRALGARLGSTQSH